jgi:hypothetical protein
MHDAVKTIMPITQRVKIDAAAHVFALAIARPIRRQAVLCSAKIKIERPCYFVYSVSSRGLTAR